MPVNQAASCRTCRLAYLLATPSAWAFTTTMYIAHSRCVASLAAEVGTPPEASQGDRVQVDRMPLGSLAPATAGGGMPQARLAGLIP